MLPLTPSLAAAHYHPRDLHPQHFNEKNMSLLMVSTPVLETPWGHQLAARPACLDSCGVYECVPPCTQAGSKARGQGTALRGSAFVPYQPNL